MSIKLTAKEWETNQSGRDFILKLFELEGAK